MNALHPLRTMVTAAGAMILMAMAANAQNAGQSTQKSDGSEGKLEVIGGTTYDWGKVEPGALKTTIEIKNSGTGILNIKDVRPSCGCTASQIDKNKLGPGEVGKISVTLNATANGQLHKYLNVTSDDPNQPLVTINLKANVKKPFSFQPTDFFSVLNGKVGVEQTVTLTMTNVGDTAFTLHPPKLNGGNVTARFEPAMDKVLKPGEVTEIKMFITPMKAGPIGGSVEIATDIASVKKLDIVGSDVVAAGKDQSH